MIVYKTRRGVGLRQNNETCHSGLQMIKFTIHIICTNNVHILLQYQNQTEYQIELVKSHFYCT